jgi:hypothetical protein
MRMRSSLGPLGVLLALLVPACKLSEEMTCADPSNGCVMDPWPAFEAKLTAALDPGASIVSSLQDVPPVDTLHASVLDRPGGGSIVVLWGHVGVGAPEGKKGTTTSAVAIVSADGVVTPIPTDRPLFDFDDPPHAVAYGSGAVVLGCASATVVDAAAGTVTVSGELPFGCNFTNQTAASMLGRGLDPAHFTAASAPEVGIYAYQGSHLQKVQTFASTGSVNAWVEEIEPGVVATVSWHNTADDISGRWTYYRSDTGAGPSVAPKDVMLDPYDGSGIERVRREADGSLLVSTGYVSNAGCTSCIGLFRWHVESDGHVERLADLPPAPFGTWQPIGFGRAVATEMGPNPEWDGLTTPTRFALLSVSGGAYELSAIRTSPCTDDALCRRFGETYTPAVVGTGSGRLAIQALWTWAGPTIVVAAPAQVTSAGEVWLAPKP